MIDLTNVKVIYMNLPISIRGYVVEDVDGFYTIVLNARHGYWILTDTLLHELIHIKAEDFRKLDVERIELYAHGITA